MGYKKEAKLLLKKNAEKNKQKLGYKKQGFSPTEEFQTRRKCPQTFPRDVLVKRMSLVTEWQGRGRGGGRVEGRGRICNKMAFRRCGRGKQGEGDEREKVDNNR